MLLLKKLYLSTRPYFSTYLGASKVPLVVLNQKVSISFDHAVVYYRIPKAANSTVFNTLYANISGSRAASMDELFLLDEAYFSLAADGSL